MAETGVSYYCNVCKGPMGPLDTVVPVVIQYEGESHVRHMDKDLCAHVAAFLAERDAEFLKSCEIVPEPISAS